MKHNCLQLRQIKCLVVVLLQFYLLRLDFLHHLPRNYLRLFAEKRTANMKSSRQAYPLGISPPNPQHLTLYRHRHAHYTVGIAKEDTALLASNRSALAMPNGMGENSAVLAFSYYAGGLKSDKCRGPGQSPR